MIRRALVMVPVLCMGAGVFVSVASAEEAPSYGTIFRMPKGIVDPLSRARTMFQAVHQNAAVRALLSSDRFNALTASAYVESPGIETTRFQHYFHGIEVVGSETRFHAYAGPGFEEAEVRADLARFDLDPRPTLSAEEAASVARSVTSSRHALTRAPELKILPDETEGSARLVYWMDLSVGGSPALDDAREVVLDAHTGQVIANVGKHIELAPVQVYDARAKTVAVKTEKRKVDGVEKEVWVSVNGQTLATACQLVSTDAADLGQPVKINLANCSRVVTNNAATAAADVSARRAQANSTKVLSYYQTKHGRNSYDGVGGQVQALVHVGMKYDNAFWRSDLKLMAYGDGDGKDWGDMTQALDVAGHEITHALVSSTAKLVSFNQAGALNEAYADIFGLMISGTTDWVVGKAIFINKAAATGIRNLANPGAMQGKGMDAKGNKIKRPYPAKMSELQQTFGKACDKNNDRCWVHLNATIPGHTAYLVEKSIGRAAMEKLYYRVLVHELKANDTFGSAATKTKQACARMYSADVCGKVTAAFASVGL